MNAGWWLRSRLHWPWVTTHLFTASCHRISQSALTSFAKAWICRRADGRVSTADRQTLLSGTGEAQRRLGHVWWLPELIYQSPPFQVLKALRRCHRYHTLDVSADKQKGMLGDGYALVYGLVPSEWTKPLTLENSRQNCEAGSRTTLETKIVTRGKHEISAHLLRCLSPREVVLKEILTILFAVSPL